MAPDCRDPERWLVPHPLILPAPMGSEAVLGLEGATPGPADPTAVPMETAGSRCAETTKREPGGERGRLSEERPQRPDSLFLANTSVPGWGKPRLEV